MKTKHFTALFLVLIISLFTVACSNDDTDVTVVGKWTLESYSITIDGKPSSIEARLDSIVLTADHHYTIYTPNRNKDEGTYEVGDNFLRFDYKDESTDEVIHVLFEIKSLDNQRMVVFYHEEPGYEFTGTFKRVED